MHDREEKRLAASGYKQIPAQEEQECQSRDAIPGTVAVYCEPTGLCLKTSEAFKWKTDTIFHGATVPDRNFMEHARGQRIVCLSESEERCRAVTWA